MANSCLSDYTLKGIGFDCEANLAGIKKVYLAYYDDVVITSAQTDLSEHTITGMTLSGTFYEYEFARNTSSLNSVLTKDEANGTRYYTNTIELVFNKLTAAKHLEVMALAAERLVALVVDNNNEVWFCGYDGYISGINTEAGTGAAADDRNGYTVTLEGVSAYLPFKYTGTITAAEPATNS